MAAVDLLGLSGILKTLLLPWMRSKPWAITTSECLLFAGLSFSYYYQRLLNLIQGLLKLLRHLHKKYDGPFPPILLRRNVQFPQNQNRNFGFRQSLLMAAGVYYQYKENLQNGNTEEWRVPCVNFNKPKTGTRAFICAFFYLVSVLGDKMLNIFIVWMSSQRSYLLFCKERRQLVISNKLGLTIFSYTYTFSCYTMDRATTELSEVATRPFDFHCFLSDFLFR